MGECMVLSALERMTRLIEVAAALSKTMTPEQVADVVTTHGAWLRSARAEARLLRIDDEAGEYVLHESADARAEAPLVRRAPGHAELPIVDCARRASALRRAGGHVPARSSSAGTPSARSRSSSRPARPSGTRRSPSSRRPSEQCAQALERARLYALEQVRREELEHSNRMKDDFLGIVSHELRTPLSAILGWARMLKRGMLDEPAGAASARSTPSSATPSLQARLVDDLLDVSRIVSGKLALDDDDRSTSPSIVDAAIDSVRPAPVAKGLERQLHARATARVTVLGDARRLQQVVWNLLTNAIKFTPPGGHIEVVLERDEPGRAASRCSDTGIGIPADVLPRVFERFKQADGTATRLYGGLGLGLSIVRHVVEAHGGRGRRAQRGRGPRRRDA